MAIRAAAGIIDPTARGIIAFTARLSVRYRHPVCLGVPVTVRGWLVNARLPVCNVAAEIRQDGQCVAQASAVFMQAPDENETAVRKTGTTSL